MNSNGGNTSAAYVADGGYIENAGEQLGEEEEEETADGWMKVKSRGRLTLNNVRAPFLSVLLCFYCHQSLN